MIDLNNAKSMQIEYGIDLLGVKFNKIELQHFLNKVVFYVNDDVIIIKWQRENVRGKVKYNKNSDILSMLTDNKLIEEFGQDIKAIETLIKNGYFDL